MPRLFCRKDGELCAFTAPAGISLMRAAKDAGFYIEAACEGSLACATCHVELDPEWFDKLPRPTEDEEAMLDCLAVLYPTSRLSCQIVLTDAMDGLTFRVAE